MYEILEIGMAIKKEKRIKIKERPHLRANQLLSRCHLTHGGGGSGQRKWRKRAIFTIFEKQKGHFLGKNPLSYP